MGIKKRRSTTSDDLVNLTCESSIKSLASDCGFTSMDQGSLTILTNLMMKFMFKVSSQTQRGKEHGELKSILIVV